MRTSEQEVRATLHGYQPAGRIDIGAAVAAGRRQLRRRRARRTAGALILPLAAGAGFAVAADRRARARRGTPGPALVRLWPPFE